MYNLGIKEKGTPQQLFCIQFRYNLKVFSFDTIIFDHISQIVKPMYCLIKTDIFSFELFWVRRKHLDGYETKFALRAARRCGDNREFRAAVTFYQR